MSQSIPDVSNSTVVHSRFLNLVVVILIMYSNAVYLAPGYLISMVLPTQFSGTEKSLGLNAVRVLIFTVQLDDSLSSVFPCL